MMLIGGLSHSIYLLSFSQDASHSTLNSAVITVSIYPRLPNFTTQSNLSVTSTKWSAIHFLRRSLEGWSKKVFSDYCSALWSTVAREMRDRFRWETERSEIIGDHDGCYYEEQSTVFRSFELPVISWSTFKRVLRRSYQSRNLFEKSWKLLLMSIVIKSVIFGSIPMLLVTHAGSARMTRHILLLNALHSVRILGYWRWIHCTWDQLWSCH